MSETLYGICENKCLEEVYGKEELNETNSLIDKGELGADIDIRLLNTAGIYICNNASTSKGYPVAAAGTLEVILTDKTLGHCIQRYSVKGTNTRYERHISEELGSWSKVIVKEDFAVLTGSMNLNGNPDTTKQTNFTDKTLNYPTGFNKDNCVVLSIMRTANNSKWSNGWSVNVDSLEMFNGIEPIEVMLHGTDITEWSNKIRLRASNFSSSAVTINYKIVLMKVS